MPNVLLIANQQRLERVIAAAAALEDVAAISASNLDDGSAEIQKLPPSIVFLQGRISGLAPEIVVKHVKSELGSREATIVLLADTPDMGAETPADFILDTSLSDAQLQDSVASLIRKLKRTEGAPSSLIPADTTQPKVPKAKRASTTKVAELPPTKKPRTSTSRKSAAGKVQNPEDSAKLHQEIDEIFGTFQQELATILGTPSQTGKPSSPSPEPGDEKHEASADNGESIPDPPAAEPFTPKPKKRQEAKLKAVPLQGGLFTSQRSAVSRVDDGGADTTGGKDSSAPAEKPAVPAICEEGSDHGQKKKDANLWKPAPPLTPPAESSFTPGEIFHAIEPAESLAATVSGGTEPPSQTKAAAKIEPSPEEVLDSITLHASSDSTDEPGRPPEPPVKFQEELDSLLNTGTKPSPDEPSAPTESPVLHGPTVEEMIRNRPSATKKRHKWPFLCAGLIVIAIVIYYVAGARPRSHSAATKTTPPAGAPAVVKPAPAPPTVSLPAGSSQPDIKPTGAAPQAVPAPTPPPKAAESHPAAPSSSQGRSEPAIVKTALPSFIPAKESVKGPSSSDPEKFFTAAAEFRVYRDKKSIKALQVIDRTGKGLSRPFFSKAIQEMAGVRDYQLESKELKGKYVVKKGKLAGNAHVILYKRNADTMLQAFVIYYK